MHSLQVQTAHWTKKVTSQIPICAHILTLHFGAAYINPYLECVSVEVTYGELDLLSECEIHLFICIKFVAMLPA